MQESDLTLYMIGQGRGVTNEALKRVMQRLSQPTGGRALFTDNIDGSTARSTSFSTSCRASKCSAISHRRAVATARGGRSKWP